MSGLLPFVSGMISVSEPLVFWDKRKHEYILNNLQAKDSSGQGKLEKHLQQVRHQNLSWLEGSHQLQKSINRRDKRRISV